jgi:hypothetical protein
MIRSIEKLNYVIGNQTHDLPTGSLVHQPTTLLREVNTTKVYIINFPSNV